MALDAPDQAHECQQLAGEVKDGGDQEVDEQPSGEALPVERNAIQHEGRGEPVEEHDQGLDPQLRESEDVHQASLLPCWCGRLLEHQLLLRHLPPVPPRPGGQDRPCLADPALGQQPPEGGKEGGMPPATLGTQGGRRGGRVPAPPGPRPPGRWWSSVGGCRRRPRRGRARSARRTAFPWRGSPSTSLGGG